MKQKLIYILFAIVIMAGCKKDPLDITPDGRITLADVFKDEIKTAAYLNSVYRYVPTYFAGYIEYALLAGITDECQDADVGNAPSVMADNWKNGTLSPSFNPLTLGSYSNSSNHYPAFWSGILHANIFLENIDNANVPNLADKSRFKAEAQLLRAFYYFEMVKQFGPMPISATPFPVGFDFSSLKRPSFQENIDFIIKDCNEVIANTSLPMRITIESERGRFSKAIAYALKSEALLYNASPLWNPSNDVEKWKASAAASKAAITHLTSSTGGNYQLIADYGDYFISRSDLVNNPKDKETILGIIGSTPGQLGTVIGLPSKPGYKTGACPTQELVDSYDMQATGEPAILGYSDEDHLLPIANPASGYDPANPYVGRDPRFYATVWYNGSLYDNINGNIHTIETFVGGRDQLLKTPPNRYNTHTGYYLRKFVDPRLQVWQGPSPEWKKYRLAQIYLDYAEAENEASGPVAEVYEAINTVRRRAEMPELPAGLNKDQMRARIRNERRVELAIEEHRFWDVRRWKILDKTDKLVTGMEIIKNPDNSYNYTRFVTERRNSWQDKFLIFPIPIGDVSKIPDFNLNQNPGW